jgi:hypothetical protein
MKYIIYLAALLLLIGCEKNKQDSSLSYFANNCIDNNADFHPLSISDTVNYKMNFYKNSKIHIYSENNKITNAATEPGNNLVFEYSYKYPDNPNIEDDEYSETIKFEIKSDLDSFLISNENLPACNAVFGKFCFCAEWGYHQITGGCIKGLKINENEWQIDINVIADTKYGNFSKMLSERFFLTTN